MMVRWSEEFQKLHPGVKFDISAGGAGKAWPMLCPARWTFGMVSRAIDPAEVEKGAFWIAATRMLSSLPLTRKTPFGRIYTAGITERPSSASTSPARLLPGDRW